MKRLYKKAGVPLAAVIALAAAAAVSTQVHAGGAGAFLGGMVTANVLQNMQAQTQAQQAAAAQPRTQTVYVQGGGGGSGGGGGTKSAEQQLQELDTLASKGYITKDEYKSRRQAIIGGS